MRDHSPSTAASACRLAPARFAALIFTWVVLLLGVTGSAFGQTSDFGDFSGFGNASSTRNTTLRIGATVDAESSATTNSTATGDDITGSDDEDGVTLPGVVVPGTAYSMVVNVTNTRGSTAYLNVWIDYNRNGSLTDSGEQIVSNTTVANGSSNSNRTINFTVPSGASIGAAGVRVRLTSTVSPGSASASGVGEVEDYVVDIANSDFGDHSSYPAASSLMNSRLRLGATVDPESSTRGNTSATGDDTDGTDDEDGVTVPASVMLGAASSITANVSNSIGSTGYLHAWVDYNRNGSFADAGEQIASNVTVASGTAGSNRTLNFTVPATASPGLTGVRVRLTSVVSPGSDGADGTGEVEDYTVNLAPNMTIGNLVWNDANENGLVDTGENGINNVLVELWTPGADNAIGGTGGNADTKVGSTYTANGGLYSFSGLATGRYFVKVPTPPLSRSSLVVDPNDNGEDNDNNGSQPAGSSTAAFSPVIELAVGSEPGSSGTTNTDNTIDFGFAANIGSPFVCDNRFYIIQNVEDTPGSGNWDSLLYYIDDDQSLVPIFVFSGKKLNALVSYAGYLYCMDQAGGHLYRINSLGTLVDMGEIAGIPNSSTDGQWGGGTALTNGKMLITRNVYGSTGYPNYIYTIDLASASLVGSPVRTTYSTGGFTAGVFGDIVWDPLTNKVYGYNTYDSAQLGLFEIDVNTGVCTKVASSYLATFGALTIDANGLAYGYGSQSSSTSQDTLYIFNRTNGVLNGTMTAIASGPVVTNTDGAACPGAAPSMKLGNQIWNDVDNDGIRESGEAGIDGVTVQLFLGGQNPVTAAPTATTVTAGGGFYTFSNLSPGQYFVYIPTPPAGFPLSSVPTATTDNSVDDDDNGMQSVKGGPVTSPLIGLSPGAETPGIDGDPNSDLTVDFGFLAPVYDFGDYTGFASASQIASTQIRVGTNATDAEGATPTDANAAGDDAADTDDEDLAMPSVVSGGDTALSIPVTLSGGLTLGRIGVWADWNGDGDVADAGETAALSTNGLIDGVNNITATLSPPAGTSIGTKFLRIRVVEGTSAPSFSGASTLKGEVEDYPVVVTAPTLDYGDLPDTIIGTSAGNYQTLSNDNGPRHTVDTRIRLGAAVDAEGNGQPNSTATGDGADDDGVSALPTLTQGLSSTLTVNATNSFGSAGFLKAWIDWNNDGNLSASEELGAEISVPNGTNNGAFTFTFNVPGSAVLGTPLGLRVRLATATIPASTGAVGSGEVEDYLVTVNASTTDFGDHVLFASAGRVANSQLRIGTAATDADPAYPTTGTASADDTTGTDDEDLTMPVLTAGTSGTLSIPITLTTLTAGRVAVWADWNGDNDVADTNEVVTLSTANLVAGTNTITATLSPPLGITAGTKFLRIIAQEGTTIPAFSGISTLKGEVEDYPITVNTATLDFGDLPDTGAGTGPGNYQTLNSDSGPSHTATAATLRLGATVDAEMDAQPNASANGDGADEDGISSLPVFERGKAYTIPVSVFNNTGSTARVFGFIDWNADGDFADAGEVLTAVTVNTSASQQTVNITGTTPGTATIGTFGARFRLATATTLGATGTTTNGEVEDYLATGACPVVSITPTSLPATTQYSTYASTLTASGGTAPYTWDITTGAIPGGLSFSTGGVFSGSVVSASGAYVFTVRATDVNGCSTTRSYTISVGSGGMSAGNLVFLDENNNGLRDANERGIPNVPVEIWSVGADGKVNSADDQPVVNGAASSQDAGGMMALGTFGTVAPGFSTLTARTDWNGAYQFTELPTGSFYFKVTPPNKTVFTSKFGTGSTTYSLNLDFPLASGTAVLTDNGVDNDNNGVQTTGAFSSAADATVAGVGAAVFSMPFTLATGTEPGNTNAGSDEFTVDFGLRPCPAISIAGITLPVVRSGVAYTHNLAASGGVGPYSYAITQGSLPSGLSMTSAGAISGSSSVTGTSAVTVRVTDARGCQGFTTLQVNVAAAMSITTSTLPNGVEGTAYATTTLAATGGTAPYQNWRVSSGDLPAGLTLNSSTGAVSGTPTAPGSYTFTLAVDDASVTPASVTVTNGSFETDAWSSVAFAPRTSITGWTLGNSALTGTTSAVQIYGINDNLAEYGDTPAGAQYLASPFVGSWASQTVSGFSVGRPYTLRLRYSLRGAFGHPATAEAQPPFYGDALWVAGYNGSAASLIGPFTAATPNSLSSNFDNWVTLDIPFIPQAASMVFSYGLDGAALDDVQFIPTVVPTATATRQFTVVISGNRDYGDLPDSGIGTGAGNYQTLVADSGPSHYRNTNLRLGALLDIEDDGLPSSTAIGDDSNGTDDEDAIAALPAFERGKSFVLPVSVFNNTGSTARVFAFIDWNNDGDFLDPSEALSAVPVNAGASQQSVNVTGTVPGDAVLTQVGLRLRLSTASSLGGFGIAPNGEVEDYLINTVCPAIAFSSTSLTGGTLGTAYSQTVSAAGGTAPYTYGISSGTLPAGVTLNTSSGVISGTPTLAGTFNFTVRATDSNGCQGTQAYSVGMVCPVVSISPASLTQGLVGSVYSQSLTASGGVSPYGSWTVTSGTLPAGLSLNNSSGVISGTPTAGNGAGTTVTVRVSDANGCQGTQVISLKICPVVTLAPATLPAATVNAAYNQTLTSSGGSGTYTYALSSGTLPAGLSLTSAGVLSGTPSSTASSTFTITATDANGCTGSRSYTLAPSCPLITIAPASLPAGAVGVAYAQTLNPGGGVAPYGSWVVTSGTLPAGLTLDAATGLISGTPTTGNGTGASFTVRTTDANGCQGTQVVTLRICPVITLTPATLANGTINSSYSQTAAGAGGSAPYTFALASGSLPVGLSLNTSTGEISGTPTSVAAATFTLRATDANGCQGTASYTITPAPDSDFGDYNAFASASSRVNSTLRIGASTDAEAAATTNATATGDDTTGIDDEDGVTLPASMTQGGATTLTVNVTNTSGATAFLNVWIDYNRNGSLTDPGEQVASNVAVSNGSNGVNRTVNFTVPATALLGSTGVRVRLTSIISPGATGVSGNGEVEDYVANIVAPTTDYGDFSLFGDAFSAGSTSLMLGTKVDLEGSATKNATATGDDVTGDDDEDAVTFPSMTAGQPITLPVTVTNTTGSPAFLNAWIDFNNNGVLTDAGEQIANNVSVATGLNGGTVNLTFTVPTNAVTAASSLGTRFRLTNVTTPGSTGGVGTGEVEDHAVVILAPLTDFGDFSGAADVSNTASTNLRLGALVDTEYAATKDATATGDDTVGTDDEDGVTIPSMIAGAPATIAVQVTNTTGSPAYLNAWIDYNNNGVFTDAGEQIVTNGNVATGTNNATNNINITVPATATTGTNLGVRVRLTTDISPGATGAGGVGEVEDYVVNIAEPTTDFGDLNSIGSAVSTRLAGLRLGALLDTEYVATTNATATGDDITGSDDEDAVTIPSMIAGGPATIPVVTTNTTGSPAYLSAWIDFNGNGVLTDAGEQIATDVVIANGSNATTTNLSITVPASALTAVNLAARFRIADATGVAATGNGGAGEVEDYLVNITAPTTDFGDFSGFADASQGVSPSLRMGASVDAEYASTRNAAATGDDTTGVDDEDGVVFPSITAGQTVVVPVTITNTTGAPGYLNAWIDFNNNGVLTDAGEQIATNLLVATGAINTTVNLTVAAPTTAVTGVNLGSRFRLSAPSGLGSTGSNGFSGEVEDHIVNIAAPTTDFGDFSRFGLASNIANSALRLGALVDAEYAATVNTAATGDDATGVDDEDGVTVPSMTAGQALSLPVTVTNTTTGTAYLNAWIDFNNDGVLTDATEQIAANRTIAAGTSNSAITLPFTVPTTAVTGTAVGIRVRLTATASPGATGSAAVAGEIEDYVVTIAAPTLDYGDWSGIAVASNGVSANLRLGALVDAEFNPTTNATATGDDITGSDDEDAVTLPSMIAGQTVTIPVIVTNTLGSTAYLNAWIDYNNNSAFDAGEQIATNATVANGLSNSTLNLTVTVPPTAVTGVNLGMRVRLTATISPGATGTGGGVGEVEDYVVSIAPPTTDFGDFSRFGAASSTMDANLRMGALVDAEFAATANVTATGDDITASDDEDGVTFPSMTAGQTVTIPVTVTNATGAAGYLNLWMDFNNDGILTDAGEQVISNVAVATGASNTVQNLSVTIPVTAVTETDIGVRVRFVSVTGAAATGQAGTGEVEDYVVQIAKPLLDYGDFSGVADAASTANSNLRMGALVDAEFASTRNAPATGDDLALTDDEDGVTLGSMTAGAPATVTVTTTNASGAAAYLNAWIDYNNNGVFTDAGEQIATNITIATGSNNVTQTLNITVPATAVTGSSLGARFRLTSVATPGPTGIAGTGEVEDYVVNIAVPTTDFGDWSGAADASSIASSNLRLGALADTEYVATRNATATGDDLTGSDDEDGVTLSTLTPGTTGGLSVVVTNNSGAAGYLNAWIDFNNNGVFTDAGEQVATNSVVANFTNGVTRALSFAVPADAIPGQRGARFRLTSTQSPGSTGASGIGEVEDYLVTVSCPASTLLPASLAMPVVGTAYNQTLTIQGGKAPYTWKIKSGSLPAGLTLVSANEALVGPLTSYPSNFFGPAASALVDPPNGGLLNISLGGSAVPVTSGVWTLNATGGVSVSILGLGLTESGAQTALTGSSLTFGMSNNSSSLLGMLGTGTSIAASWEATAKFNKSGSELSLKPGLRYEISFDVDGSNGLLQSGLGIVPTFTVELLDGAGTPVASTSSGTLVNLLGILGTGVTSGKVNLKFDVPENTPAGNFSLRFKGSAALNTTILGMGTRFATISGLSITQVAAENDSSTVIVGVPSSNSGTTVVIEVTDANGCPTTREYPVNPVCPALALTPSTMPPAIVGTPFSQTMTVTGGTAPYTFAVSSGTLPAGLSLNTSTGVMSGTPTSTVATVFALRATDTYGCSVSAAYSISPACAVVDISPSSLPGAFTGTAYSATLAASPTAAYAWSVADGTLPAGLSLNQATGVISGTPTTLGARTFTVRATTGAVNNPQMEFATPALNLNPGDAFNIRSYVRPKDGSTKPIDWSRIRFTYTDGGANDPPMPADWNLAAFNAGQAVLVTGADATAGGNSGTGRFRIYLLRDGETAYDAVMEIRVDASSTSAVTTAQVSPAIPAACSGTRTYTIAVCPVITLNPASLPAPEVSIPYNQTISPVNGEAPFLYTVASGTLPDGLALNATTGALSGTPTTTGASTFTLRITDANGCQGTRAYSITTAPAPTLDYGDFSSFSSASSTANSRLRLGAAVDAESSAKTNSTADGDDMDNVDDEDGIVLADTITPGMTASLGVRVTNTRGSTAYLHAWIDYNRNGVLVDTERIASNVTVANGSNNVLRTINFTVPAGATMGVAGVRVRLTSVTTPGPDGQDGVGEVEDTTVNIAPPPTLDFGDYALFPSASSTANSRLRLGAAVDTETYSLSSPDADGDDTTGSDDEDGVTLPASVTTGASGSMTARVTNSIGSPGYLNAWVDYNRNGDLSDPGEQIADNTVITTSTSNSNRILNFSLPVSSGAGPMGVRVRLTNVPSPGPDGEDGIGEVEDHILTVLCPTLNIASGGLPNGAVGEVYAQTLNTTGGNGPYTYLVLAGSLPQGLSLDSSGQITGTPVGTGSSSFTVHVSDASGCTTAVDYTLAVFAKPSVGNLVWNDLDNDGQKDSNEPGVAGVYVELLTPGEDNAVGGTGANADTLVSTTVTDANGGYTFSGLSQGRYYIRITPPDNLPLPSSVVVTADNGVDNDNNGSALANTGGPVVSPVITLTAGGEPGTNGTSSVENTIDFGLIVGNSVLWLIDEDYTLPAALHLWSFTNYRTPATTVTDYGRLKYRRPSDNTVRDIADAGDIEAMAVNRFTGEAYILSRGRISGAPSNTQSLWYYNLNDAADNIGNIVLTLIGHVQMQTAGAYFEGLAYDPDTKRFYMADPKDDAQNSSTTTDRLYYLDIRNLNSNVMLATNLVSVGDMAGQGQVCRYTDGLEFSADGKLYAVDGTDDHVYEISRTTGAIVAVADSNLAGGPGGTVDVETLAWDEVSSRMIAVDNAGQRFIEVTLGSAGANIAIASYVNGVPGMPSTADMEASAMYDTHPPQPRVGVGNAVFIDSNYNGKMDAGEGADGVKVELYEVGDTPGVDSPLSITTTAGGGLYAFKRLLQDDYFVHIPASNFTAGGPLFGHASIAGVSNSDDDQGEDGIDDAQPLVNGISSAAFTLTKDAEPTNSTGETGTDNTSDDADDDNTDLTIDFGFQNVAMSIGNLVWSDVNNNGLRDAGELGIGGVTVQLYTSANNVAGDADDVLYSGGTNFATTSASGLFSFSNIPPGKYVLRVTPPAGYATGGTPVTVDNGVDNDNNGSQPGGPGTAVFSPVITLTPNTESVTDGDTNRNSDLSVDFGLFTGISLGNLVWNDADNNGLKGASETGVPDVTVELLTTGADNAIGGTGANADTVVQSTVTNSSGAYNFTVYTSGRYYLRVTPTAVLQAASSVFSSADNAVDNDSNGTQPGGAGAQILSPVIQLTAGGEPGSGGTTNTENTLDFGLRACPAITVAPTSLTAPIVGQSYSQTFTATGGSAPYTFTVSAGSLPAGLALTSGGVLSGTTTSTAVANFTIRAQGADGCSGTRAYTLTPACPTLTLNPAALPPAYLGAAYTPVLAGVGGTSPYTFALQSGTLPSGISFSTSGAFSGVPTVTGTFNLVIAATDANGCSRTFSLALQVRTLTLGNLVYEDSNRNGVRDAGEPGIAGARVQLFATGADNAIGGTGAAADMQAGSDVITGSSGAYLFTGLPGGNYYVKVTPPADYLETGGAPATADNNINDNNDGSQPGGSGTPLFSPVINLAGGTEPTNDGDSDPDTNLTIDFGLWSSVAVGNFVFLDINGDGVRNEGESLGNIFVELYAEGATPGVSEPVTVGATGCSCKGRYYLEGLNPGNYFLHIPASQFASGMPLEGLVPMANVVPGDDNIGQDLIYNSTPSTNGASTAVFTLRPGLCPVGAAESGGEGTLDDDMDGRVDLTRDLGVMAPAGSGFAAGASARRWLVTDETTGSVRADANTFAAWRQTNALGAPEDDADADGSSNLLEYALGTDPFSPLQSARFVLGQDAAGGVIAQLTVPVVTRDDINVRLETLTDLTQAADSAAWKKVTMATATTFNNDGTLTRTYSNMDRLLVFKGLTTGFVRLKVELDADRNGSPEASATTAIHAWSRQTFATGTRTFSMPLALPAVFTGRVNEVAEHEVMLPYVITLPEGDFYLEVLEGVLAGHRFEVDRAASSGNTLVLKTAPQGIGSLAGARISVRPHNTLGAVLPATAFNVDDRLMFFNTSVNDFATVSHDGVSAWASGGAALTQRPLPPQSALLVNVRGAGTTLTLTGEVRMTGLVTPMVEGTQFVGSGWPVAVPAPVAGLKAGLSADSADRLRLWNGDASPDQTGYSNWYLDGSGPAPVWKAQTGETLSVPTQQPFHGIFLVRDPGLAQ